MSLPLRERGLKYLQVCFIIHPHGVAPFAGAWIEMLSGRTGNATLTVAPFAGAWIEI